MTLDTSLLATLGAIVALLVGVKSSGLLKPWLTHYAKADELEKLAGRMEDVSIEIKEINGKFERFDTKLDKIVDAVQDTKLNCARKNCDKGE